MKIYVTDDFQMFMKKANITDEIVVKSAEEVVQGLHDGNLDMGKLFKKRIASPKQSKRDSNRSVVAVQGEESMFFIQGWRKSDIPKSGKEIPNKLLEVYKLFGASLRNATPKELQSSIDAGVLREVKHD
ncbi:type II toxin-antitoxin system RelE/ParE family toxin [Pseudidiomarina tainanensis]|uniref:type II toxin-antitoxin system RelE/ParE family toxin n=1 Tax=Pseudidiomarina tainanensis TaxID=502365 RepID=UPI0013EEDCCB|nr:type II toxin-antitoxin system RelE/ParE family toxin [Pseudidiomarina tainanensis]